MSTKMLCHCEKQSTVVRGAEGEGAGKATTLDVVVGKLLLTKGHSGEFAGTSLEIQTEELPGKRPRAGGKRLAR